MTTAKVLSASAVVAVASLVGVLVMIGSAGLVDASSPAGLVSGSLCATSGPIPGLGDDAARNARTVAAVASARAGDQAALLVVVVGLTESGLRALGNPAAPAVPVGQGVGFDHDSVGIFQQRASWGSAQQRMDPVASTNLLLDRLLAIDKWQRFPIWVAAQRVQGSAWDGRPRLENGSSPEVGGNYHARLPAAAKIVERILADSVRAHCTGTGGSGVGQLPAGPVGAFGLPVGFVTPAGSVAGRVAVGAALAELGRPYVFGATGPDTFDCSGLTQWAWGKAGVSLPHYTVDQWHAGVAVTQSQLGPGDLVLTPGADGTPANPQHVGMFIGSGLVVEAPQTGDVVKVVTYSSFVSDGLSGLRRVG